MMLAKLRKDSGRKDFYPNELVLEFCGAYWHHKPTVKNSYAYFKKTFYMVLCNYNAEKNQREAKEFDKVPTAGAINDLVNSIVKEMET